jgi:quercetin dioxygenase-like cupin family protein
MTHFLFPDWREKVVFSPSGPQPQVLAETGNLRVIIAGLEPGQKIPSHPEATAMYHFLDGNGWMSVDGERFAVGPGATVITPEGSVRGIEAETRLAFLAARTA